MQLPSNKIATLFIVVVLIVVLVISGNVVVEKISKDNQAPEIIDADLVLQRKTTDKSSADGDKDGLLDWQETLYGSNNSVADSDGDGVNDGDEVKAGRNPSIKGPDDKLVGINDLFQSDLDVKGYTPGSLTDNLSIDLFSNYLNQKQANALTSESGQQLANQIAEKVSSEATIQNKYKISDLKSVESSKENLNKYGVNFALLYDGYIKQMKEISEPDDKKYVSSISEKYKLLAEQLAALEIPNVAINVHLEIINKTHNAGVLIEDVNNYETDPVKSLLAIKNIKENSKGEYELFSSLANYFKDNDIIFTDNNVVRFWNLYE